MSMFRRRPFLRWLVPVVVALMVTAGVSALSRLSASADTQLTPLTSAQILVAAQQAQVDGLSGIITQNADLGLPSLPGVGDGGSSNLTSLVSGSHTLRLWYAGPNRVRLSLLGTLGESDVVRNGTDLWTWSSTDQSATHRSVPLTKAPSSLAGASPVTPQQAADEALKAITPSTKVTPIGTSTVADRPAYELLLQPNDSASLVDSVRIAFDGETHIPLRVQVFARGGGGPAFEVAFTKFDPTTPSSSMFTFNPPPGTKVTQQGSTAEPGTTGAPPAAKHLAQDSTSGQQPKVVGSGWTSVVVTKVPGGTAATSGSGSGTLTTMLHALPKVSGTWGSGHLLHGTLFSALLTDDGRLAVGAVAPSALYDALSR